jgi:hypothetical protein
MRNLTPKEIDAGLDNNGEPEDGFVAIEATVNELSALDVRTLYGDEENHVFQELAEHGFGSRRCRGWYLAKDTTDSGLCDQTVAGMFHIVVADEEAEKVARIAKRAGGMLRPVGASMWDKFYEFEIEH